MEHSTDSVRQRFERTPLNGSPLSRLPPRPEWPPNLPALSGSWDLAQLKVLFDGVPVEAPKAKGESAREALPHRPMSLWPKEIIVEVVPDPRIITVDPRETRRSKVEEMLQRLKSDGFREGPTIRPLALAAHGSNSFTLPAILDRIESFGIPARGIVRVGVPDPALTDWVVMVRGG